MTGLMDGLRETRRAMTPSEWRACVVRDVLTHPIREVLHQDPLTHRAFSKPRGYAGDATLLDFIYECERPKVNETAVVGSKIYAEMVTRPAARAVRYRRAFLASTIDRIWQERGRPISVLSIAAGHARELELSRAAREGGICKFVALDQDQESLRVATTHGAIPVSPVVGSVRGIVAGKLTFSEFDLVYASGLFDYLDGSIARRLATRMFQFLAPGGTLLVANFLDDIQDVGYMESFMDWTLILRTASEVTDLLTDLPAADITIHRDPDGNIVFGLLTKSL